MLLCCYVMIDLVWFVMIWWCCSQARGFLLLAVRPHPRSACSTSSTHSDQHANRSTRWSTIKTRMLIITTMQSSAPALALATLLPLSSPPISQFHPRRGAAVHPLRVAPRWSVGMDVASFRGRHQCCRVPKVKTNVWMHEWLHEYTIISFPFLSNISFLEQWASSQWTCWENINIVNLFFLVSQSWSTQNLWRR